MTTREITKLSRFYSQHGTHKYRIEYEGEWSNEDLVAAIDNKKLINPTEEDLIPNHFGGYVKRNPDDKSAIVHVYYD